ncbi:G-type lectin S-receptor-like serine/threonine-protein kinase [Nymphaea thermarum]|nr:G-type lectin S-receptor-like serine/threonine-protein kinase [Nymphaea thermarum]
MVKLSVPRAEVVLLVFLFVIVVEWLGFSMSVVTVQGLGFRCATAGTCTALVGYRPLNATTLEEISSRFQIDSFTDLLPRNSLPSTTPKSHAVSAQQTIRVPITCRCQDGIGTSDKSPVYIVKAGDTLDYIATSVFSKLVDAKSLAAVSGSSDPSKTNPGQVLRIPLPCSCDRVDGSPVTHYALVVEKNDTLSIIAANYNVTMIQLEKLNNISNTASVVAGQVLDVPLPSQDTNSTNTNGTSSTAAQERYHSETIYLGKGANESDDPELPLFKLGVIMEITNNFSESNKLGQGGFGPVYKGTLAGEQDVAVKRLSQGSKQGYAEFMNEVKLIAKLQHKNLVQLLGCCVEREERILIYEYMPNKSLDKFLFDPTLSTQLVWEKRVEIMVGIARGLQYLHQESRLKVIHRDLKTSNILLDGALNPKISDFGLARAFSGDHTQVNTHRVVGTFGYMPPEYAMEGRYSTKSDVFSFGVIVLEIVSGQKMTAFHNVEYSLNLLGHVDAADRPTMSSIVLMLSSDLAVLPKPKQPAYSYRGKLLEASSSSIESDPKTYTGSELTGSGFRCTTDGTCQALVGYTPEKETTIEQIISLFQIPSRTDFLEINSRPPTTPLTLPIPANQTVRVPFTCRCEQGTGNCDGISPYYVVKEGDTLDYIANSVFGHLVDAKSLATVGHVPDGSRIKPGAILWIPLPCSCDRVDGAQVTHYAVVVQKNDTLNVIAARYNTTAAQLAKLNNLNNPASLVAGQVLDVPLPLQAANRITANNTNGSSPRAAAANHGTAIDETDNHELPFFQLEVIMAATDNFSESNKLGQGGFGPVYKGTLAEGEVAVKRLSHLSKQGYEEFMNEVKITSKLQHKNLVQLIGCCVEGEERILIYEYMPNRSLNRFLFDPDLSKQLVWEQRFEIILGIARGLHGYMSPEYAMKGRYSTKSDVFSFGVIILEIAWKLWNEGRWLEFLDPVLDNSSQLDQVKKCINVGLLCVQSDAADRPTMSSIVLMLSSDYAVLPKPKRPAYSYRVKHSDESSSNAETDTKTSTGELTITALESRVPSSKLLPAAMETLEGVELLLQPYGRRILFRPLLLAFCFIFLQFHPCLSGDTISAGHSITGNQTITSKGGKFELGYFSLGSPARYYIGIWFKDVTDDNVVWVANRDTPLQNNTAELKISKDGSNLVIQTKSGFLIWSTNSTPTPSSHPAARVAVLQNNGNLALMDGNSSSAAVVWESFDHPTDTFLPDGRVGVNKVTKQYIAITSWKSKDDPSSGLFSQKINPNGSLELPLYWNNTQEYWTTGVWDGQIFTGMPEMRIASGRFNASFVVNDNMSYYTYSVYNKSTLTRTKIDVNGQIQQATWRKQTESWYVYWRRPADQCDVYAVCGAFGVCNNQLKQNMHLCECLDGFEPASAQEWESNAWSGGCRRKNRLQCEGDDFTKTSMKRSSDPSSSNATGGTGESCGLACMTDCSCTAYSYRDRTCFTWKGDVPNLVEGNNDSTADSIFVRVANSGKIANSGIANSGKSGEHELSRAQQERVELGSTGKTWSSTEEARVLELVQLVAHRLGELRGGQEVAIKRLSRVSKQGIDEFMNELKLIAKVQHTNLVQLVGCCAEGEERILIYEYMPNKSLDHFLFDPILSKQLGWEKRFEIVMGIARGLQYLHQESRLKIIHRDLKTSNILLDAAMNPRISDFGLARIFCDEQSHISTMKIAGTCGYMPPEYAMEGRYSTKSDVFSFGVIVLEVVSGLKMTSFRNEEFSLNLLGHAWKLWNEDKIEELLDHSLGTPQPQKLGQVLRCVSVGLLCVQEDAVERPTMSSVVLMLSSDSANLASPSQPAYSRKAKSPDRGSTLVETELGNSSTNDITVSDLQPR